MTNRTPEIPRGNQERSPEYHPEDRVVELRNGTQKDVQRIIGPLPRGESYGESVASAVRSPEAVQRQVVDTRAEDARREIQDHLQTIQALVSTLQGMAMEHRAPDFRDRMPIWGNYRSHSLAGREGEIIDSLQEEMKMLDELTAQENLSIDLRDLRAKVNAIAKPKGMSKLLGTLLPHWRRLHREWTTPNLEEVTIAATRVRQDLRRNRAAPALRVAA